MTLVYKNEYINDAQGNPHAVIDIAACDFENDPTATYGMKTAPVFAFRGKKDQEVITEVGSVIETQYKCAGGEVVFVNHLPSGQMDVYVPRDGAGNSTGEQILKDAYTPITGNLESGGGMFAPNPVVARILLEVIEKPTVIPDAYGPGSHVFLEEGATLKINNNKPSGINPEAFVATWAVTDENGVVTRPARPPAPNFYDIGQFQKVLTS